MDNASHSATRRVGFGPWWALNLFLLAGWVGLLVFRAASGLSGPLSDLVNTIALVVGAMAFTQLAFGVWGLTVRARGRAVQLANPTSIVSTALRSPAAGLAVQTMDELAGLRLPIVLFIVANADGISLRTSPTGAPLVHFAWSRILRSEPTVIIDGWRSSNGVSLVLSTDKGEVALPLVVIGRGMAGMYPLKRDEIKVIVSDFERLRNAWAARF